MKPFIKWNGGKSLIVKDLVEFLPENIVRYYEPFCGSAGLYFGICEKMMMLPTLSDINRDLIITYNVVKFNVNELILLLIEYTEKHCNEFYYEIRDSKPNSNLETAARFIYLNKTCFNGLYRVNKNGEFNVPIGHYKNPLICDKSTLYGCSKHLQKVVINWCHYNEIRYSKGDFVYLDPPYQPITKTSSFTGYTVNGFTENNHRTLKSFCDYLTENGVKWMQSNSDTEFTRSLYSGYNIETIEVRRRSAAKAESRKIVNELVIRNYV